MHFLVDMCCLCLNNSNAITLKSLVDLDNDHVTFYDKLTTSLSNLVTGTNSNEYKVCMKCCSTIRQVYKCNNMFTRNMTTYMKYKTLLNNILENNQSELVSMKSKNIDDIKSELTEIIKNEGASCLVDMIDSLEFPKIKDEIIDELSQDEGGQLDNPSSLSDMVIEMEELDIKPDDSSYEEECMADIYWNDSYNQNTTIQDSNEEPDEDEDVKSLTQNKEATKEIYLHKCEDLSNKTNELLEDDVHPHNDSRYRQTTIPNSDITNLAEQITIGENNNTSTNKNKRNQKCNHVAHKHVHTGDRKYVCNICNKDYKRKSHLTRHAVVHSGERKYVCNVCNKAFFQSGHLKNHQLIHTGEKNYVSNVYKKRYEQRNLTSHELVHSGNRKYVCNICNKGFKCKSHLTRHTVVHTGEKKYVCNVCNKAFNQSEHLKNHQLIHADERNYVCNVCNKAFIQSGHLKYHQLMHAGEKKYICNVCNKRFYQQSNLASHELIHTGDRRYVCNICNKGFNYKCHLTKHAVVHTDEKKYVCNV